MQCRMRTDEPAPQQAAACLLRLEPQRDEAQHPELDRWRANVGAPVAFDSMQSAAAELHGVDVLCWNVAIGLGKLDLVLQRFTTGFSGGSGFPPERPLVILLQEAYRADGSVPDASAGVHHGGRGPAAGERTDVATIARSHGLSLRYSPSMRNGSHPSDRGNAILSTVRLADARAVVLPLVRQRRVAVTASIAGHPDLTFVSAHLDTHGTPRTPSRLRRPFGRGRAAQAAALGDALGQFPGSVVLGADLNSYIGMTDPAVRALIAAGMHPARRVGGWRHTFHTPLKLLLDHVLYRSSTPRIISAEVTRLDEAPADRSRTVFGSDHHPLLARVDFDAPRAAA
jgi:endonuclease/exonuclease/phosphatase family metal-dependent hydrolase